MGKVFRDPLYNYIELSDGSCALDIVATDVFQRLRRIHQLGVSHYTYPGAQHDRLSHSLGVYHLARFATENLARKHSETWVQTGANIVQAVALLHDVGHGPFSHLVETCLGVDHEDWTCSIIQSDQHSIKGILEKYHIPVDEVVNLIRGTVAPSRRWMKTLVSSQLDVDRLDYLRRDSLMTGSGYGHFDYHRLLHTAELKEDDDAVDLIWPRQKALYAIEEYIFARYYMYQNVYMHKTTRGIEVLLRELWRLGKQLFDEGNREDLTGEIAVFWEQDSPSVDDYLAIEEFVLLHQIALWRQSKNSVLADLASRFLDRNQLVAVNAPLLPSDLADNGTETEAKLCEIARELEVDPTHYVLRDEIKPKYRQPYIAPPDGEELTSANAIRVLDNDTPIEISSLLDRLRPVTKFIEPAVRFYVPREVRTAYLAKH